MRIVGSNLCIVHDCALADSHIERSLMSTLVGSNLSKIKDVYCDNYVARKDF